MPNILFSGFVYDNAGDPVTTATINLYDRNTTTPSRASTTSNANGYWTISHATEGRFDVAITAGSAIRRRKYDDQLQLDTLEVANFQIRNPASTFKYNLVPGAITADRTINLPVVTGTDTFVVTDLAQTLLAKTLTTPTIAATGWTNANHTHTGATTGGSLSSTVTRAGGNTTEATTTSTTAVDLLTVTGLTIVTTTPIWCLGVARKTSGSANLAEIGLKLNTTVVGEVDASGTVKVVATSAINQAESRNFHFLLPPRITDYNLQGSAVGLASAIGNTSVAVGTAPTATAAQPIATITDVILRGIVNLASITLGTDEFHVNSYPTS